MSGFQRILFPVDLSQQCRGTAPYVRAMAERFGAEVTLLHALDSPAIWYQPMEGAAFASAADIEEFREARKQEINTFLAGEFGSLNVLRVVGEGDPAAVIREYAHNHGTDLIMMSTHGDGPFRSLLLGSIAAKVLHDVACPVWTGVHVERMPAVSAAGHSILCAVDLEPESVALMVWAASLASALEAEIHLVHAVPVAEARPDKYFDTEFHAYLVKVARGEVGKLQRAAGTDIPVILGGGRIADVVRAKALEVSASLVLIGRGVLHEALGRLRSDAYSIIRHSPCPVISV